MITALIPFALAGVFVPSWTKYVIILLSSGKPKTNALSFIFGNATFRFMLGTLILMSYQIEYVQDAASDASGDTQPYLVALGLLMLGVGVYLARKQPTEREELPRWLQALERIKPWVAFGAGFAMVAAPGVQWVYFLGGMSVIAGSTLDLATKYALMFAFIAFLELMLLTPVGIYALGGEKASASMASFKTWLGRNEFKVFGLIIGLFGFFVLLKAI